MKTDGRVSTDLDPEQLEKVHGPGPTEPGRLTGRGRRCRGSGLQRGPRTICLPDLLPCLNNGERPLPPEDGSGSTLQKSGWAKMILASGLRHPQGMSCGLFTLPKLIGPQSLGRLPLTWCPQQG